jgi:autotransporter-associated beta strand protein
MSLRTFQLRLLSLSLPAAALWLPAVATAQSTWVGTTNTDWGTVTNWVPGIPAAGGNVAIADATTNNLLLNASQTIGSLSFGSAGLRNTAFTLNTQAANNLTLNGGIIANGTLNTTALTLSGHYTVAQDQTWSIIGSATGADQGVFLREAVAGAAGRGSLKLDANLTKTGSGQLVVAAMDISGAGNLIVNEGLLKYNAGANQPLVVAGPGNVTLNGASILAIFKNSGTMTLTRPIVMNGTSSLQTRVNVVDLASPITFNGTHGLDAAVQSNLTGAWTGGGTINRTGAGTLNLTGSASGFTGTLNANAGTTILGSAFGGSLNVGNGATLAGEVNIAGNLTLGNSTLSTSGATPASLAVGGNVTLQGTVTVNLLAGAATAAPFNILTYGGTLTGNAANFTLTGGMENYRSPVFSTATPGTVTLAVGSGSLTWAGGEVWDVKLSPNWTGAGNLFHQLDAVTFGNTGAGNVIMTGLLLPASVTVDSSADYTFTAAAGGLIAGNGTFNKAGSGTLTLGGVNTFTGGVRITGGTLIPAGNQALGPNDQVITVSGGGMLELNGALTATRAYQAVIAGTGINDQGAIINTGGAENTNAFRTLTLTGNATIGGNRRWDVRAPTPGTSLIDLGGFTLTKLGTNTIAFVDGVIANDGRIDINEGIFSFTRSVISGTGPVTVNNGATMRFENYTIGSFSKPIVINGSTLWNSGANHSVDSDITLTGNATFQMGAGNTLTLTKSITGTGNLVKTEAGTLQLNAPALHEGTTTITAGPIQIVNGGALNSQPVELATTAASLIFNRTADLTVSNVISGSGVTGNDTNPAALTKAGTHALTLTGANTYTGTTRLAAGTLVIGSNETVLGTGLLDLRGGSIRSSDASPRELPNPISFSVNTVFGSEATGNLLFTGSVAAGGGSKMFTISNARTEFSGTIAGTGAGTTLTKAGPGTLVFSGDNTYTQTTTISSGVLQVGTGGTTGTLGSSAVINNASLVINRSLPEGVSDIGFNSVISGTGSLTHAGPAFTVLGGLNTYTGDTIITNGTLSPSLPYLADGAAVRISGAGKLDLFHAETDTVDSLYINGVPQAAGLWGRVGSTALGANFETPFITGDGLLLVSTGGSVATPYDSWAVERGLTSQNNAPGANPDGDRWSNLAEFAIDGNPLSGADGAKVAVRIVSIAGGQVLTLSLPVRTSVGAFTGASSLSGSGDGVTYRIEGGDALATWTLPVSEVTGADATAAQAGLPALRQGWVYRTFRTPGTISAKPMSFMRARFE